MILPNRPLATASRRARALVMFCALALLPLGVAQAGEPDYEAVGDRLLKAVAAGELSPDQAEAMMGKLAKVHFAERLAVLKAKTETKKGWVKKKARQKRNNKALAWIPDYLEKIGLDKKQAKLVQGAIKKVLANYPEGYGWLEGYLKKIGLEGKQIDQVELVLKKAIGIANAHKKLRDHYRKLGIDGPTLEKIAGSLEESGLEGEQIEQALGGIARLLYGQLKPDAPRDELREGLVKHFQEAGFSGAQIEHMVGLSKRLFPRVKDRLQAQGGSPEEHSRKLMSEFKKLGISPEIQGRVKGTLLEAGLEKEQLEATFGGILRMIHGMRSAGDSYELDPKLKAYLREKVGLSDEQFERVVTLSRRLSAIDRSR